MLTEQKKLLADVKAATATARKLCEAGVKLGSVYASLKTAAETLDYRLRALAAESPKKPIKNESPAGQRP